MTESAEDIEIDTGVAAVSYTDPQAPALFAESLRTTGFGVLKDHPVPQALVDAIHKDWLAFFDGEAAALEKDLGLSSLTSSRPAPPLPLSAA